MGPSFGHPEVVEKQTRYFNGSKSLGTMVPFTPANASAPSSSVVIGTRDSLWEARAWFGFTLAPFSRQLLPADELAVPQVLCSWVHFSLGPQMEKLEDNYQKLSNMLDTIAPICKQGGSERCATGGALPYSSRRGATTDTTDYNWLLNAVVILPI